ncbi:cell division protein [Novosphingobium sp. FSY-8]|uniref:Cell division protein n=1 Tax=Novosphingobium ovatum TaxID=1908523 RepID=A0ABW9XDR9_9SPHN|nr:cell division protein [Novosphingobium ovatum]
MGRLDGGLVPQARLSGPTPWVIAIMVALTVIAAAMGLVLRHIAAEAAAELTGGVTIQILDASPSGRQTQAEAALRVLRAQAGVGQARQVPQAEVDRLIAPWLGADTMADRGDQDIVPVPALIDVRLEGAVDAPRLNTLRAALQQVAPAARVDAQSDWLGPVFGAIESLQWLAAAVVALLALALAAAAVLATRTALGAHRATIEVVHLMGGTDSQIARIFERSIGWDAAIGGLLGFGFAVGVTLFLGRAFAALGAGWLAVGALQWNDWLVLTLVPIAAAVITMLTARLSVIAALRKIL